MQKRARAISVGRKRRGGFGHACDALFSTGMEPVLALLFKKVPGSPRRVAQNPWLGRRIQADPAGWSPIDVSDSGFEQESSSNGPMLGFHIDFALIGCVVAQNGGAQ